MYIFIHLLLIFLSDWSVHAPSCWRSVCECCALMSCGCYFSRWRNEVSSPQGFIHSALHPLTQAFLNLPPSSCNARRHSENGRPFKALRNGLAWRSSLLHAWPHAHSAEQASSCRQTPPSRPLTATLLGRLLKVEGHALPSLRLSERSFVFAHLVWSSREAEHKGLHSYSWPCCLLSSHSNFQCTVEAHHHYLG